MFLNYNLGSKDITIGDIATKVNDGRYHVVRFSRSDINSTLQVDDNPVHSKYPQGKFHFLRQRSLDFNLYVSSNRHRLAKDYTIRCLMIMEGRRLFSRRLQNFPGGRGAKPYYLPKKHLKDNIFFQKNPKSTLFWPARGWGARSPSCPPLRTPIVNDFVTIFAKSFNMMQISLI